MFRKFYTKYEVPDSNKDKLKQNYKFDEEVRMHFRENQNKRRVQTQSMVYVPYEICSYTRKIRMQRGRGKHCCEL